MRALTVVPLRAGSAAVTDMPEPELGPGELLVEGVALGVCGTDREIMDGEYGWAFCRNGGYTERGIREIHGYGSERWTVEADYAIKLDPALEPVGMLMEPTSVVAKAWDQIARLGSRAYFAPERVLVTGAGPIGLLAARRPTSSSRPPACPRSCSTRWSTTRPPASCA